MAEGNITQLVDYISQNESVPPEQLWFQCKKAGYTRNEFNEALKKLDKPPLKLEPDLADDLSPPDEKKTTPDSSRVSSPTSITAQSSGSQEPITADNSASDPPSSIPPQTPGDEKPPSQPEPSAGVSSPTGPHQNQSSNKLFYLLLVVLLLLGTSVGAYAFSDQLRSLLSSNTDSVLPTTAPTIQPTPQSQPTPRIPPTPHATSSATPSAQLRDGDFPLSFINALNGKNYRITSHGKIETDSITTDEEDGVDLTGRSTSAMDLQNSTFYYQDGTLARLDYRSEDSHDSMLVKNDTLYYINHLDKIYMTIDLTTDSEIKNFYYPLYQYSLPLEQIINDYQQNNTQWQQIDETTRQAEWKFRHELLSLYAEDAELTPYTTTITINQDSNLVSTFSFTPGENQEEQEITFEYEQITDQQIEEALVIPDNYEQDTAIQELFSEPTE